VDFSVILVAENNGVNYVTNSRKSHILKKLNWRHEK